MEDGGAQAEARSYQDRWEVGPSTGTGPKLCPWRKKCEPCEEGLGPSMMAQDYYKAEIRK